MPDMIEHAGTGRKTGQIQPCSLPADELRNTMLEPEIEPWIDQVHCGDALELMQRIAAVHLVDPRLYFRF